VPLVSNSTPASWTVTPARTGRVMVFQAPSVMLAMVRYCSTQAQLVYM
jgi:hypothetical protein